MTHKMHLTKKYFDLIKSGKKLVEFRIDDCKRGKIKSGDRIVFRCGDARITKVVFTKKYGTLDGLVNSVDCQFIGELQSQTFDFLYKIYGISSVNSPRFCAIFLLPNTAKYKFEIGDWIVKINLGLNYIYQIKDREQRNGINYYSLGTKLVSPFLSEECNLIGPTCNNCRRNQCPNYCYYNTCIYGGKNAM